MAARVRVEVLKRAKTDSNNDTGRFAMSRFSTHLKFALAVACALPLWAQQSPSTQAPKPTAQAPAASHDHPAVGAVASATAVATVEAIDQKTREVTLKKESGELVTIVVSEEARNLPQVKKG